MELLLRRQDATDQRTIGQLFLDGAFYCFTLEDALRQGPKVPGETAISAGRYRVTVTRSERFQAMLPLLLEVPGFTGVRIHGGNTAADTSGCILVGFARTADAIEASQSALHALLSSIARAVARSENVWIEIVDPVAGDAKTVRA